MRLKNPSGFTWLNLVNISYNCKIPSIMHFRFNRSSIGDYVFSWIYSNIVPYIGNIRQEENPQKE